MDVYIVRQPVLDRGWNVAAWEFLVRSGGEDTGKCADEDALALISNAAAAFGGDRVLGNKPAFIRLQRKQLLGDYDACLDPAKAVIEITKDVLPDRQTLGACEKAAPHGIRDCAR